MRTPATIARHPIHPMIVPIPIGLWLFSFVCDLAFVLGVGASFWATLAFYTIAGGIIGAIAAAVPGVIDLMSLHGRPKAIALAHLALNVTIVVLYAINFGMRLAGTPIAGPPLALSVLGVALLGVSGWLGGHLVYVHRVGVDER